MVSNGRDWKGFVDDVNLTLNLRLRKRCDQWKEAGSGIPRVLFQNWAKVKIYSLLGCSKAHEGLCAGQLLKAQLGVDIKFHD